MSTGPGDVPWEDCFRTLGVIGRSRPISVELEDAGMDRLVGAAEAVGLVRRLASEPPEAAFDAAVSSGKNDSPTTPTDSTTAPTDPGSKA